MSGKARFCALLQAAFGSDARRAQATAGVDNTVRRKWDKDEYAAKAAERKTAEARPLQAALTLWRVACAYGARCASVCPAQEAAAEEERRAKVNNSLGLVVRKPLSVEGRIERDYVADLRARVGTKQLVNPDTQEGAGFFCKESGKLVRDSISYLDHINGKKRALPLPLVLASPALRRGWRRDARAGHVDARGAQHAGGGAGAVRREEAAARGGGARAAKCVLGEGHLRARRE